MIFFIILICIGIYLVLAIAFIAFIAVKFTNRPLYTWLAIAFVILLPTWDVLLGAAVYFPACLFIPKVAIYETAETEGIYYEGKHDYIYEFDNIRPISEKTRVGTITDFFRKTFTYAESRVTKKKIGWKKYQSIPITYYHCTPLQRDEERPQLGRTNCTVIDKPMSRYMVKTTTIEIGTAELIFDKIIDRTTGKLMAENRLARLTYSFPFFYWLYEGDGPPQSISCSKRSTLPKTVYYHPFEFDVLKPKQQ